MRSKRGQPGSWKVYLILDQKRAGQDARLLSIARKALAAHPSVVQLRLSGDDVGRSIALAKRVRKLCRAFDVPFMVNDRVDIALASNADGLHVGQGDIPAQFARRLVGEEMLLGVSASTIAERDRAIADGADYIGAGPVFATPVKRRARALSPGVLKEFPRCRIPVVAIGGITADNAARLRAFGFQSIAVIRSVMDAADPAGAVQRLFIAMGDT